MTLRELYAEIGGDYDRALKVLRIEKLLDKHIRRLPANTIFADLKAAGESMDATGIFESAHAIKGVSANLGLVNIADLASKLSEEFRPGNARSLSDGEVRRDIDRVCELYDKACGGISRYAQG